ncbi:MAG: hypothetical protein HZB67_01800 [Candidatus Aenigmarchaeota archaeon]|nr:hypothetical protein [Candidatus Aenigmarchaeota archaeon]
MDFKHGNVIFLLLLIPIIAASGCIGQSQTNIIGQNGLQVKDFYTDPSEDRIESGDVIDVTLAVENVGGTTAQNVQAELLGADWVGGRLYPQNEGWLSDDNGDGVLGNTLSPPNPQYGYPGVTRTALWRIPTPVVPEGLHKTYNLKARITYDYSTKAAATIRAYSRRFFDAQLQQGKQIAAANSIIAVQHTIDPAPITVSISGPDKIVVPERSYQAYTYQITFTNVGGGAPITNGVDGLIYGSIWLNGPAYFVDCMGIGPNLFSQQYWGTTSGSGIIDDMLSPYKSYYSGYSDAQLRSLYVQRPFVIDFQQLKNYVSLKLRRGESVTKSCTIAIPNPDPWGNYWGMPPYKTEDSMTIFFDLNYRYYLDADTQITVTGPISGLPLPSGYPQSSDTEAGGTGTGTGGTGTGAGSSGTGTGTGTGGTPSAGTPITDSSIMKPEAIGTSVTANTCAYECKDSEGHDDVNSDGIPDAYSTSGCMSSCSGVYYGDSGGDAWCASQTPSKGKCCCDSRTMIPYICLYRSTSDYPFGCWITSLVDQKRTYYEQQSGCSIVEGGYRPRSDPGPVPYVGECTP